MAKGEIWGLEPPVHSDATYHQITLALIITAIIIIIIIRRHR